jgi:hypothetical protein
VGRRTLIGDGEAVRTACARVLIRSGIDEKTGEILPAAVVAERIGWCTELARGMAAQVLQEHWNAPDMAPLASGRDAMGRPLPTAAWMAVRRLGWPATPPEGVTVNDRVVRMAQEQAGRVLRSAVRGQITDRMRHLAAEHGIAVVTVPPRGTSKNCPRCLSPLRHCKAPDKPATPGWKWAACPEASCGWQGDRDRGAWQRIAARGLTHQAQTLTDRATGAMVIRAIDDPCETAAVITAKASGRDRSKAGPTRRRTSRPAPRRRGAPSPPRLSGHGGQRPEGHATTVRQLPRAARRDQDVTTTSTPARRPHRARGAALGAGFHLHAHATPPRRETIPETLRLTEDH